MEAIKDVWFSNERIYVILNDGTTMNRPLEAFPTLKIASDAERNAFEINRFGDALRWKELDEDIHVGSFMETQETELKLLQKIEHAKLLSVMGRGLVSKKENPQKISLSAYVQCNKPHLDITKY